MKKYQKVAIILILFGMALIIANYMVDDLVKLINDKQFSFIFGRM